MSFFYWVYIVSGNLPVFHLVCKRNCGNQYYLRIWDLSGNTPFFMLGMVDSLI